MKKKIIISVIAVLVAAAALTAMFLEIRHEEKVSVTKAKKGDFVLSVQGTGVVRPKYTFIGTSPVSGIVEEVFVTVGQEVAAGDKLFKLDDSEAVAALELYKLGLDEAAGASQASAAANSTLMQTLALAQSTGLTYEALMAVMEEAETTASTSASAAALKLEQLEKAVEAHTVTSNIEGKVLNVSVTPGQALGAGTAGVTVGQSSVFIVKVNERDINKIAKGMKVNISSESFGNLTGTVTALPQTMTHETTAYGYETVGEVEVSAMGAFDGLIGMTAEATIEYKRVSDCIMLPMDCLLVENGDSFVYAVVDGKAEKRKVVLGELDGYTMQIKSGVAEGEDIVLTPEKVTEGAKVNAVG